MTQEDIIAKLEASLVSLMDFASDIEKDYKETHSMLVQSENRIDEIRRIVQMLVKTLGDLNSQREKSILHCKVIAEGFEKRIEELRTAYEGSIARLEKRLEKTESRADQVQDQNDKLIMLLADKDKQIIRLEDRMFPQTGIHIG